MKCTMSLPSWCCDGTCIAWWHAWNLRFFFEWWSMLCGHTVKVSVRCVFQIQAFLIATGNYGIFLAKVNSTNERNICSLHAVTSCFPVSLYMQLCSFLAPLQWRCTVNFWSCLCNWQWPWGPNWVDGLLSMQDCMCWNLQWFDGVACKCKACFHHFLCATCSITSDSWDTYYHFAFDFSQSGHFLPFFVGQWHLCV